MNNTNELEPRLLSKKEMQDYLGISYGTLHNWMVQRRIPYFRCGGRILFRFDRVLKALDACEVKALPKTEVIKQNKTKE